MNIIKKIKTTIRRQKMKKLLKTATELIYTNEKDLPKCLKKMVINKKGLDLLYIYLAIQTAAEAKNELDKFDVNNCLGECDLLLASIDNGEKLDDVSKHNQMKADVSLIKAELGFALGKFAYEENELSAKGTIYYAQKLKKGPLTYNDQKEFMEMSIRIIKAQQALDEHNRLKEKGISH